MGSHFLDWEGDLIDVAVNNPKKHAGVLGRILRLTY